MSQVTIGGVSVCYDYLNEAQNFLDRFQNLSDLTRVHSPTSRYSWQVGPTGNTGKIGLPVYNWPAPPPLRINQVYWPVTGASRWAYGLFLATGQQKADILAATSSGTCGYTDVVISYDTLPVSGDTFHLAEGDDTSTVTLRMFPLTPMRIAGCDDENDMFLMVMVDQRYWWQFTNAGDLCNYVDSWSTLIARLATRLQIGLSTPTIPSAYDACGPHQQSWLRSFHNAALLLDAATMCVGGRVVSNFANNVITLMSPWTGSNVLAANLTSQTLQLAGSSCTNVKTNGLPERVDVLFPLAACGHLTSGCMEGTCSENYYSVPIQGSSLLSTDEYCFQSGTAKSIHVRGIADYPCSCDEDITTPSNANEMAALAIQIAADYYHSCRYTYDMTYNAVSGWNPCYYDDYVLFKVGVEVKDRIDPAWSTPGMDEAMKEQDIPSLYRRECNMRVRSLDILAYPDCVLADTCATEYPDRILVQLCGCWETDPCCAEGEGGTCGPKCAYEAIYEGDELIWNPEPLVDCGEGCTCDPPPEYEPSAPGECAFVPCRRSEPAEDTWPTIPARVVSWADCNYAPGEEEIRVWAPTMWVNSVKDCDESSGECESMREQLKDLLVDGKTPSSVGCCDYVWAEWNCESGHYEIETEVEDIWRFELIDSLEKGGCARAKLVLGSCEEDPVVTDVIFEVCDQLELVCDNKRYTNEFCITGEEPCGVVPAGARGIAKRQADTCEFEVQSIELCDQDLEMWWVRATSCITPGSTDGTAQFMDYDCPDLVIDNSACHLIALPGEDFYVVAPPCGETGFRVSNAHGLQRLVRITECIDCDDTGSVPIVSLDPDTGAPTVTECLIPVVNLSNRPIGCWPEYATSIQQPGQCYSHLIPHHAPTRATATLAGQLCVDTTEIGVNDFTLKDACEGPEPAGNIDAPYGIPGCEGQKVELAPKWTDCECTWEIVQVEPYPVDQIITDISSDDPTCEDGDLQSCGVGKKYYEGAVIWTCECVEEEDDAFDTEVKSVLVQVGASGCDSSSSGECGDVGVTWATQKICVIAGCEEPDTDEYLSTIESVELEIPYQLSVVCDDGESNSSSGESASCSASLLTKKWCVVGCSAGEGTPISLPVTAGYLLTDSVLSETEGGDVTLTKEFTNTCVLCLGDWYEEIDTLDTIDCDEEASSGE